MTGLADVQVTLPFSLLRQYLSTTDKQSIASYDVPCFTIFFALYWPQ